MDKAEADFSLSSNKVYDDAKHARESVEYSMSKLRVLESNFHRALDVDKTLPVSIATTEKFGDKAMRLSIIYDRMVVQNKNDIANAEKILKIDTALMVCYSLVSIGKLCEAVLAILPATGAASKALKALGSAKMAAGVTKDFAEAASTSAVSDANVKALEGSLKMMGEQGQALADLIGGGADANNLSNSPKSATVSKATTLFKLLKATLKTMQLAIEQMKHVTKGSTKMGRGSALFDFAENLLECYTSAMKATEAYDNQMRTAGNIGKQTYHGWKLQGRSSLTTYASRQAFENAIYQKAIGADIVDTNVKQFGSSIRNATEARTWGMELQDKQRLFSAQLAAARHKLEVYAKQYGDEMGNLLERYKAMLPHLNKLLKSYKDIVEYETKTFGPGRHGSVVGQMPGHLAIEINKYNAVIEKAKARLKFSAEMSEALIRKDFAE